MKNTGGRSAKTYALCRQARTAIGLDITRNHITAVAVDLCGDVISTSRIKYAFECTDEYFHQLGAVVDQIIRAGRLDPETILGVGISLPALVTADNESVFYGDILNITGLSRSKISKYISYPTMLFNDAHAAGNFAIDPWAGLPRVYTTALPAYTSADDNATYAIIGDLSALQVNYPEGEGIIIKWDDMSLAEEDLVKVVGRQYAGCAVTGPGRLVRLTKPAGAVTT
jgi:hypothetical protein